MPKTIVVRLKGDNFEIIAGERRWRAAQRADFTTYRSQLPHRSK